MFEFIKNEKREGTGGILFLFISFVCALTMVFTITWIRDSTARSVAQNTEHTIALQCLAACYSNNAPEFKAEVGNGYILPYKLNNSNLTPLDTFNEIMVQYKLMDPEGKSTKMFVEYKPNGKDGSNPTFELQAGSFHVGDSWWENAFITITPNPMQVVIEDN